MGQVTKWLDIIWNLRPLTGHRTQVAKAALVGLSAYQWAATSQAVQGLGIHLPPLEGGLYAALMVYFGGKIEQFSKEHA